MPALNGLTNEITLTVDTVISIKLPTKLGTIVNVDILYITLTYYKYHFLNKCVHTV